MTQTPGSQKKTSEQPQRQEGRGRPGNGKIEAAVIALEALSPEEQAQVYRRMGAVVLTTSYKDLRSGEQRVNFITPSVPLDGVVYLFANTLGAVEEFRRLVTAGRATLPPDAFELLQGVSVPSYSEKGRPDTPPLFKEIADSFLNLRSRLFAVNKEMRTSIPSRKNRRPADAGASTPQEAAPEAANAAPASKPEKKSQKKSEQAAPASDLTGPALEASVNGAADQAEATAEALGAA